MTPLISRAALLAVLVTLAACVSGPVGGDNLRNPDPTANLFIGLNGSFEQQDRG